MIGSREIEKQNLSGLIRSNLQCRLRNDNHAIALFSRFTVHRDRAPRHLDPRIAHGIHRAFDFLTGVQHRRKETNVLVQSY